MNLRERNLFDKLMCRKPFIYKDKDKLIIIGGHCYFEDVKSKRLEKLYSDYENINLEEEKEEDKEIFNSIYQKSIPNGNLKNKDEEIRKRKEIREYILELNDLEIKSYENQIQKYETLYKRYISKTGIEHLFSKYQI